RENAINRREFEGALSTATNSVERNLDKLIEEGLDPDGTMTDFVKDSLISKIKSEVWNQLNTDKNHIKRMDSLWERASKSGYSRESLSSIVSAVLDRARPIIPGVRSQLRSKALGRKERRNNDDSVRIGGKGTTGRDAKPLN